MRRLVGLLIMTILVGSAVATPVPVGGTLQAAHTETFNLGASGTADVVCNVYGYASGDFAGRYVYTYQINNHSTIGISFFSVELKSGANVDSLSDAGGGVNSAYWGVVNTMISANGSFTSPIAYNASLRFCGLQVITATLTVVADCLVLIPLEFRIMRV